MAAVLDRPDALGVQRAPPVQQPAVPGRGGAHGLAASQLTRERVYRGGGVGRLVWVRGDHDHVLRPFVGMSPDDSDRRWTNLSWGEATLLSSHAGDPRKVAGD